MTQPTALFLANILEYAGKPSDIAEKCAKELRRLHAERTAADGVISDLVEKAHWLQTQRDALLEALQNLDANPELTSAWLQARAAIKAAEENT